MKREDLKYIQETIENEGFEYAFTSYSDFENIEDEEFHRLRREFLASAEALATYCQVDL